MRDGLCESERSCEDEEEATEEEKEKEEAAGCRAKNKNPTQ